MRVLAKFVVAITAIMSSSVFSAQTTSDAPAVGIDSLTVKDVQYTAHTDSIALHPRFYSLRIYPDSVINRNRPYNQNAFKFRYDAFKEQMKNPWIADALREILYR